MIAHPSLEDLPILRSMWKDVFKDTNKYIELYFKEKFSTDSCLVYKQNEQIVSMIYYPQYDFKFHEQIVTCGYICGAATLWGFRGMGYMAELIEHAFVEMQNRGDSFSVLIPANDGLFKYYENFGFKTAFYTKLAEIQREDFYTHIQKLDSTSSAKDICSIYEKAVRKIKIAVLQSEKSYNTVVKSFIDLGGDLVINESKDTFCFVYKRANKLHVKEIFSVSGDCNAFINSLFTKYKGINSIVIDLPGDNECYNNTKLIKTGMVKCFVQDLSFDETDNPYMNMMLN